MTSRLARLWDLFLVNLGARLRGWQIRWQEAYGKVYPTINQKKDGWVQ